MSAERRITRLQEALAKTQLTAVSSRDGRIVIKTQAPVQKGERLLVSGSSPLSSLALLLSSSSLPYANIVKYRSTEQYCSHCFMKIGLRAVQSRFCFDFYGFSVCAAILPRFDLFQTCRNLFDHQVKRFSSLLRNEFRSRAKFKPGDAVIRIQGLKNVRRADLLIITSLGDNPVF